MLKKMTFSIIKEVIFDEKTKKRKSNLLYKYKV